MEERLRYEASSYLSYRLAPELNPDLRERALALPEKGNPAARALAEQWQARLADPAERSRAALTLFRKRPSTTPSTRRPWAQTGSTIFCSTPGAGFVNTMPAPLCS